MRTEEEIRDEMAEVRCSLKAMRSSSEKSIGLINARAMGDRQEAGTRPRYQELLDHLKELEAELAAVLIATGQRSRILRSVYEKGL